MNLNTKKAIFLFFSTPALRIYKYFLCPFLVLILSIFTSRGRMGGDQLEAYKLALDFYNYTGNINNFISSNDLLILDLRWFWASLDFIFIKLFPSNINLIICTLLPAIFSWIAKQERLRISERTRAGLQRAKANGRRTLFARDL